MSVWSKCKLCRGRKRVFTALLYGTVPWEVAWCPKCDR